MLDTDICIYIIKSKPEQVIKRFKKLKPGDICLSIVTVSELYAGVEKSAFPERNRDALEQFLLPFDILDYGIEEAKIYGQIRANLEKSGMPIGAYDLMIAAHCLCRRFTLVTNNIREYERVPRLIIENWV
jgi:tRNA(fMet)-specific endonuclease VapC